MPSSVLRPPSSVLGRPSSVLRPLSSLFPWLLAGASGLLLAAVFAPFNQHDATWFALVPLLVALKFVPARRLFLLGFSAGAACWLVSLFWLTRVTAFGWFGLSLYCALYLGVFAWLVGLRIQRVGTLTVRNNLGTMALAATGWGGLEYLRSILATGFPWNPLAASQHHNVAVLQVCAWGGAYALSALIVWVNAGVALTFLRYIECRGRWGRRPHAELIFGFLLLTGAFMLGWSAWGRAAPPGPVLRAAVVQTDIPQDEKWDRAKIELIYRRLRELTRGAVLTAPHLVIWPETALPDDVRSSPASYDLVYQLATSGVPLLVGSMDSVWPDAGPPTYYNCSFLFDGDGAIVGEYRKRHLVPFGEYVPLRHVLPFLKAMTPIEASFTGGHTSTVFRLPGSELPFGALICFEDTVASLAREAVQNGARLLINQTNDAWFDPWWAQWQHMAHSILRAVENGVPVIRCANSGVSCFIDARGRVVEVLERDGQVRFPGYVTGELALPGPEFQPTFYTRHGDLFARTCVLVVLLAAWSALRHRRATPLVP
jgi:apolipoprotein N-acyltransferase